MEIHRIAVAEVSVINHLRFLADVHGIKQPTSETASMNGDRPSLHITVHLHTGSLQFLISRSSKESTRPLVYRERFVVLQPGEQ